MSKNSKVQKKPDDMLAALLANAQEVSQQDLKELGSAVQALDQDAGFVADYLKGLIVEDVRRALKEDGITQNALADRMGKSRQYLNKVLDQDRRVNFTIETMAEISTALKRRLFIRVLGPTETATIFRVESKSQTVRPLNQMTAQHGTSLIDIGSNISWAETHYTPKKEIPHDNTCLRYG